MNWARNPKRTDQLRSIPLQSILRVCGARLDRYDRCKWHTIQGVLSVQGPKFINWNQGRGGGGAIDLVIHLNDLSFAQALQWLERHFPQPLLALEETRPCLQAGLNLPPLDSSKLGRVRDYLIGQRAIPKPRIDPLIESGTLYADARANAVFLMRGKDNHPVGAELRGTTVRPWRGMAPGSRKDLGFFCIAAPYSPGSQATVLCESAIDAISCSVVYPCHRCLSTAGARPDPTWLAPLLKTGQTVYCGFDADSTGEAMSRAMIARHPEIKRLRPGRHDWNDVLRFSLS